MRHPLLPILALAALLLSVPLPAAAAGQEAPIDVRSIESQMLQQQKRIHRLKKGIEEHTERIRQTSKRKESLQAELAAIESRLNDEEQRLAELRTRLADHEHSLRQKQEELSQVMAERDRRRSHLEERLAAYYRMGDIGVVNLLFSASTLPELLNIREYFHRLLASDQEAIGDYRRTIGHLYETRTALQEEKRELLAVISEITAQQEQLTITRRQQESLLAKVETEQKLYQRAVEEMEEATQQLLATFEALKKKAASQARKPKLSSPKKRRPADHHSFAELKGKLPPPVAGTVVTRFGRNTSERYGITTIANGIDIRTAPGAKVSAIYDGTVVYAGVLKGYGNLVIVDHGKQHYSLVSRMATILVREDEKVHRGEPIGEMGGPEALAADGLHFEIRIGTEAQDPLEWIDSTRLAVPADKGEGQSGQPAGG